MKAIRYTVPGIGLYDVAEPYIKRPDDVKIRVAYAGICGSDIHIFKGDLDKFFNWENGSLIPIGHEASGVVEEVGPEATVKGLKTGDKVAYYYNEHCGKCYFCRNGQEQFCLNIEMTSSAMQEYLVLNEQQVFKLPDDMDLAKASMIEPISVCLHGIDICKIKVGSKVVISGAGAIGFLMIQLAKLSGAARLTVIEPVEEKRELAKKMGVEYVVDPINQNIKEECNKITDGLGYDVVIETSGATMACQPAFDILSRGGMLQFFAGYVPGYKYPLDLMDAWWKEATITTVHQSPYMFPRAIEMAKYLNLDVFIKNIYPPEKFKEAFDMQMTGKPVKVIFKF